MKEKLTITFESDGGKQSASYEWNSGMICDDLFWDWFVNIWTPLGMPFLTAEIKNND